MDFSKRIIISVSEHPRLFVAYVKIILFGFLIEISATGSKSQSYVSKSASELIWVEVCCWVLKEVCVVALLGFW